MEAVEIAYLRRTGPYGPENRQLMERLKAFLKERGRMESGPSWLGSPWTIPAELRRTGAGMMWASSSERGSGSHWTPAGVRGGRYAVFEIPHTEREVSRFWEDLERLTAGLPVDRASPVLERYSAEKVALHRCEFCIPLK